MNELLTPPDLPTVTALVARQLEIQDRIETGDIPYDVGRTYIENLSKIISGAELAEQLAKEPEKEDLPVEPTFGNEGLVTEQDVKDAMVKMFTAIETGKMSAATGMGRMRVLESIAKTFKGSLVEIKVGADDDAPLREDVKEHLDAIEVRLRGYHDTLTFAASELSFALAITPAEAMSRITNKRSLADKKIKAAGNGASAH